MGTREIDPFRCQSWSSEWGHEGTFEGPTIAGVGFRGHVEMRGTGGAFVGLKIQATSTNTPEAQRPFVVTGTIR